MHAKCSHFSIHARAHAYAHIFKAPMHTTPLLAARALRAGTGGIALQTEARCGLLGIFDAGGCVADDHALEAHQIHIAQGVVVEDAHAAYSTVRPIATVSHQPSAIGHQLAATRAAAATTASG